MEGRPPRRPSDFGDACSLIVQPVAVACDNRDFGEHTLHRSLMAQYVYTMNRVGKMVPPKRVILKDISLSFFPGAKIGVLGLNGSGKSSLLRIMAGEDKEFDGEAVPMPNMRIGYLPQEPLLDPSKTVRESVEEGLAEILGAKAKLDEIYAAYAEPDADFDKLAAEQAKYEAIISTGRRRHRDADGNCRRRAAPIALGCEGREPVRRREAPGGAVPPALVEARHAAARRADQPPGRRERRVAGAVPAALSRAP
jgi:ABC-type Fe3+/spermidine/putrescine transport system ATPase subunit